MKKQYDTGFDFDGTTDAGLIPDENGVIITGRDSSREADTRAYLKTIGREKMPIIFYPTPDDFKENPGAIAELVGKFKAEKIKELGVKTFYEDNPLYGELFNKAITVLPLNCSSLAIKTPVTYSGFIAIWFVVTASVK